MTDYTKKPLAASINEAASKRARDAIDLAGKALPCSVVEVVSSGIVTVKFEVNAAPFTLPQVTIPVAGPEYVRFPLQPGCMGVAFPVDVRIGNVSGLGGGVPDLTAPGNLTALVFFPVGSANWPTVEDTDEFVVLYGEAGVRLQTKDGSQKITVSAGRIDLDGNVFINGEPYLDHEHSDVQTGGSNTGGVV